MDKPYTFTPGEYLTRDGHKAVVLCTDAPGEFPLKGYVVTGVNASWRQGWGSGGDSSETTLYDLMPPAPAAPEAVVRWVATLDQASSDMVGFSGCMRKTLPSLISELKAAGCTATSIRRVEFPPGQYDTEDTPSERNQTIDAAIEALRSSDYFARLNVWMQESLEGALLALKQGGRP